MLLGALNTVAPIGLGAGASAWDVPRHELRFQHAVAVRSALHEHCAHTTANRFLSALRGVLKAGWQLGLMSAELLSWPYAV